MTTNPAAVTTMPTTEAPTTLAATTTTALPELREAPADLAAGIAEATATAGCDPLDSGRCVLPYPSNFFTKPDQATDTGLRVDFPVQAMPVNAAGTPIDTAEYNRNDGFSPNSSILTLVPGLDAAASKLPPWTDIADSLDPGSPVAIVDMTTGERVPLFAELDAKATDDADRLLVIHPAIALPEGHRFAVALRAMRATDGSEIVAGPAFTAYRDRYTAPGLDEERRPAMEEVFAALAGAGIARDDLFLAWDFTVISTRNLSERMLAIRDLTLEFYGNSTPEFTVTSSVDSPDGSDGLIARQVQGIYTVPNFLTGDGGPGNRFFLPDNVKATPDWLPQQNGIVEVPFACNIPSSVTTGATGAADAGKVHIAQYGHGLLGSHLEIDAGNVRRMSDEHHVIFCATKWAGMSEDDVGNAAATLQEMSNFPTMADRLQQGVLNQIALGRLMKAGNGLFTDPAFDIVTGRIDTDQLDYDGNSQGGIMGLMLAAVSPDIERAVVGVPGINYSLLLPRSVDFDTYEAIFAPAYPNPTDRTLIISMIQMLWDRGEGGGYVQHLTASPYKGTNPKQVLFHVAIGDHQVSPIAALIAARTVDAAAQTPLAAPGRLRADDLDWGLKPLSYPADGSAIVFWDSGAAEIPLENLPPRDGPDSHEDPRASADARRQKAMFLFQDQLVDVCSGKPCTADPVG